MRYVMPLLFLSVRQRAHTAGLLLNVSGYIGGGLSPLFYTGIPPGGGGGGKGKKKIRGGGREE